jgi:hypothetical protein
LLPNEYVYAFALSALTWNVKDAERTSFNVRAG